MKNKGFTLVEMIAVIVLIAVLAVIGVGTYTGMNESAKKRTLDAKISELKIAAEKWARENNITNKTTLSVNALVVEGYINADNVDTKGLAEIKNPVTGENMICNTIDVSYENGELKTIYNDKTQNCKLASQSQVDTNISIRIIDADNIDRSGAATASIAAWTNKDVLIITDSDKYDTDNLVSISYDFDGSTITKDKSSFAKYTDTSYLSKDEAKKYYNVFSVDSELLFNAKIVVTYNFIDDLSKSRSYTIRIDKEEAMAYVESSAEWISEETPITIKVDDGNGSGSKYFYLTKSSSFVNPVQYEAKYTGVAENLEMGKYYIWTEDNAGNRSNKYKIIFSVNNIDKTVPACEVLFHGTLGDHGWYISDVTPAGKNTVDAGISGMNIGVNMTEGTPTYTGFAPHGTRNEGLGEKRTTETVKAGEDYYCHVKTLAGKTGSGELRLFLDKTPPVIRISVDYPNVHTQTKTAHVQISDALSGLNESTTIKYGFSMSNIIAPSNWTPVEIPAAKQTNSVVKKDFTTSEKLTGTYYMWVDTTEFKDYAGNHPNSNADGSVNGHMFIFGPYKFDNTSPVCNGNNGKTYWTNGTFVFNQNCIDNYGTTDQSQCVKDVYVVNYGNTKTVKDDKVTISDKAGNTTVCDYSVYLDNTAPVCGTNNSKTNWTKGNYKIDQYCEEDNVNQSGCGQTVYSYDYTVTTKNSSINIFDKVGNRTTCSNNVYLDNTPPSCNGATGTSTVWINTTRTIGVKCSEDNVNQSGCKQASFPYTYSSSVTDVYEKIYDNVGNETTCGPFNVYIDIVPPTCGTNNGKTDWSSGTYTVVQNCLDLGADQSGCKKPSYSTKYSSTTKKSSVDIFDIAGNKTTCDYNVYLDTTPPICDGEGGKTNWTKGSYTVSQKCKEDNVNQSGCGHPTYTKSFTTTTKDSTLEIFDKVGNKSVCTIHVYLDNTAPTCGAVSGDSTNWTNSNRTVKVKCEESSTSQSGCSQVYFSKTASSSTTTATIDIKDNVGNQTVCGPYNFYVDKVAPTCSVGDYGNHCTTAGVTATVSCNDATPDSSGLKKCAGLSSSSAAVSGIRGSATYTVTDNAGNSNTCIGTSTPVTQYRKRTCAAGNRCETAGCEAYRTYDCDCKTCYACYSDGWGYCDTVIYDKNDNFTSQDCYDKKGVVSNDGRCIKSESCCKRSYPYDCRCKTCTDYTTCVMYYASIEKCGCASWNAWSNYTSTVESCAGAVANSCETETRIVYHHGSSC